jgi:hypothetical protein
MMGSIQYTNTGQQADAKQVMGAGTSRLRQVGSAEIRSTMPEKLRA